MNLLAQQERGFARLVEVVAAARNLKSCLDRPVEKVGFGESEYEIPLDRSELRGKSQSLAEPEKIIGLVRQADKDYRRFRWRPRSG